MPELTDDQIEARIAARQAAEARQFLASKPDGWVEMQRLQAEKDESEAKREQIAVTVD